MLPTIVGLYENPATISSHFDVLDGNSIASLIRSDFEALRSAKVYPIFEFSIKQRRIFRFFYLLLAPEGVIS